jgi:hypothetical protein
MTQKYANYIGYSDVQPYEVVRVVSEKTIDIRPMSVDRDPNWKPEIIAGGFMGHCTNQDKQTWIITSDEEAETVRIRYSTKRGCFQDKYGRRFKLADEPRYYYDYNF